MFSDLNGQRRKPDASEAISETEEAVKYWTAGIIAVFFAARASADDPVVVTDMTQLQWQADPTGKVYIRNLSQFDSTFLGCCYNFYIDTTTAQGKVMWSAIQVYMTTGGVLEFFVGSKSQPGPVTYLGNQ
jgi:hypothetical protein